MELWTSALLILVVSSAGFPNTEGSIEVGLEQAEQQLEQLTSRFVALSNKLDSAVEKGRLNDLTTWRLTKSVDDHQRRRGPCEEYYFPCASGPDGGVQCIRDYLVCDRYKDCKNGADEAEDLCKVRFPTPITFRGNLVRNECEILDESSLNREGEGTDKWTLYRTEVNPWFPSRPQLPYIFSFGTFEAKTSVEGAKESTAVYDYATGDIILPNDPVIGQVGRCKLVPVSPEKTFYRCDLERNYYNLETKQRTCYSINWTWDQQG